MLAEEQDRDSYLGASQIPGVCGLDPYNPRWEVWARLTGRASAEEKSPDMMRGIYLEPVVRENLPEWKDRVEATSEPDFHFHPDLEFVGSHNDGYARVDGCDTTLEIKCPGSESWQHMREQGTRTQQVLQAQIGAGLRDQEKCIFAIHNADEWLTLLWEIPFREELYEYMMRQAEIFWEEHVLKDVPPDPFPDEPPPDEIPSLDGEALHVHDDPEFTEIMEKYARYQRLKKKVRRIYEGTDERPGLKEEMQEYALEKGHEEIIGEAGKLYYRPDSTRKYFKKELVQQLAPFHPGKTREVLEWYFTSLATEKLGMRTEEIADGLMQHLERQARLDVESDELHTETNVPYLRAFPSTE